MRDPDNEANAPKQTPQSPPNTAPHLSPHCPKTPRPAPLQPHPLSPSQSHIALPHTNPLYTALATAPFGASAAVPQWPYLSVTIASCGPALPIPPDLPHNLADIQRGTWARANDRLRHRISAMMQVPGSPRQRAQQWNTYMASVLPYPSQT